MVGEGCGFLSVQVLLHKAENKIVLSSGTQVYKLYFPFKKKKQKKNLHIDFFFLGYWHLRQVVFSALTSVDHEAGQPFLPLIYHLLTKGLQTDKNKS